MTTTDNRRDRRLSIDLIGMGVLLLIAGFVMRPLLRFAEPGPLAIGGVLVAAAIVIGTWPQADPSTKRRNLWLLLALLTGGLGLLVWTIAGASASSKDFDRVCGEIQQTMTTTPAPGSKERGARPVDQFRAMGCRPQ